MTGYIVELFRWQSRRRRRGLFVDDLSRDSSGIAGQDFAVLSTELRRDPSEVWIPGRSWEGEGTSAKYSKNSSRFQPRWGVGQSSTRGISEAAEDRGERAIEASRQTIVRVKCRLARPILAGAKIHLARRELYENLEAPRRTEPFFQPLKKKIFTSPALVTGNTRLPGKTINCFRR